MDTQLTPMELEVKSNVRAFLEKKSTPKLAREWELTEEGVSLDLWKQMTELGWSTLCLSEDVGGGGLPIVFGGLVAEEVGRHISPVPYTSTVAAAFVVDRFGSDALRRAVLNGVVERADVLCSAVAERGSIFDLSAMTTRGEIDGDSIVITGTKRFVDNFSVATSCIVACRTSHPETGRDGISLVVVDPESDGITAERLLPTAKDSQSHVHFAGVRVPLSSVVGDPGDGARALSVLFDVHAALLAGQMAGAARHATERAAEYAKVRHAFGQPIGSFQAIQHMCADMLIWVDGAELLSREALWWIGETNAPRIEASQAKAFANVQLVAVCRSSQQIHGGMGFMMEFDLNLWYRRVASWALRMGNVHDHRARVAAALLDQPGEARLDTAPPSIPLLVA